MLNLQASISKKQKLAIMPLENPACALYLLSLHVKSSENRHPTNYLPEVEVKKLTSFWNEQNSHFFSNFY